MLRGLLGLKLELVVGLGLLITVPYFATTRLLGPVARGIPSTWLDALVPYSEPWAWIYVSLYFGLLVPLLSRDRVAIVRYAWAVVMVCCTSHALFVAMPTTAGIAVPRPSSALAQLIVAADGEANACPSLHASLAVLTAIAAPALFGRRRAVTVGAWVWALAVVFSALATKRHVAIDLGAGALLALAAWWLTRCGSKRSTSAASRPIATVIRPSRCARSTEEARVLVSRGLEAEIHPLRSLDWRKRAGEILVFAILWTVGAAIALSSLRGLPPWPAMWLGVASGVFLCAIAINAFVLLLHEGMHSTLFGRRALNHAASMLFGGLVLMSFSAYRVMHTRHHIYLGDPRDPDDYHNYTGRRWLVWCLHYMRLFVGTFLYILLIPVFAVRYGSRDDRIAVVAEYSVLVPAWIAVASVVPTPALVTAWALPVLVVAYFTSIRGFTQHGITDAADPFLASRSIRPSRLVAYCLLNENLHLEHHLFPEIPSYNLAKLNALIAPRIPYRVTGTSYLKFIGLFISATLRLRESPIGLTQQEAK